MTAKTTKGLTIVIKLGTSSIISPTYPFLPQIHLLSSVVETVVHLRELGHRVVLVSSGAIGVGVRRMGFKERGKGLSRKQALAAIGQGRLIALWDNLFSQLDQPIAQILLTRTDISDRTRYLNAQNTFSELLNMGVVPIVNENDTVSVSEIKFGDNDTLSAIASAIVHADYLFLLTDVDCLYTDNPRSNPDAKPVLVVRDIEKVKQQVSTATLGTSLGTGGMSTKLIAAELATAAGTTTVIMHSEKVRDVFGVIKDGPGPSRADSMADVRESRAHSRAQSREGSRSASRAAAKSEDEQASSGSVDADEEEPEFDGPVCTRFLRNEEALKDRKWWVAHGLRASGTVVIDEGAYRAISKRESGGRLLPAGVIRVDGAFAAHQAVRIVVRRRREAAAAAATAAGGTVSAGGPVDANASASAAPAAACASSPTSPQVASSSLNSPIPLTASGALPIRFAVSPELSPRPKTPTILPALSLSSSIASLDPLSRTAPNSPALRGLGERLLAKGFSSLSMEGAEDKSQTVQEDEADRGSRRGSRRGSEASGDDGSPELDGVDARGARSASQRKEVSVIVPVPMPVVAAPTGTLQPVELADPADLPEWEEVEVGKGLAQYNSLDIDRCKGLKSAHIERIIGYSESEHVVDSIALIHGFVL
ncbi:Glutamate 5-kinase [Cryptotrichosporon argae]